MLFIRSLTILRKIIRILSHFAVVKIEAKQDDKACLANLANGKMFL